MKEVNHIKTLHTRLDKLLAIFIIVTFFTVMTACEQKSNQVNAAPQVIFDNSVIDSLQLSSVEYEQGIKKEDAVYTVYPYRHIGLSKGTILVALEIYKQGKQMKTLSDEKILMEGTNDSVFALSIMRLKNEVNSAPIQWVIENDKDMVFASTEEFVFSSGAQHTQIEKIQNIEKGIEYPLVTFYGGPVGEDNIEDKEFKDINEQKKYIIENYSDVFIFTVKYY